MDYYGLLFLYYLKGLSGKSILRLFFNIEAGGTEQLLPENTSTPTTTPILADIQYPDGLRTDQYFTYRETPTTVSNKARIKTIKGNTLVWNQLVRNGNFADNSYWKTDTNYGSIAIANNVLTYTAVQIYNGNWYNRVYCSLADVIDANHKLLIKMRVDATKNFPLTVLISSPSGQSVNSVVDITSSQKEYSVIVNTTLAGANTFATIFNLSSGYSVGDTLKLGNIQVFDLTKMGLDISNPSGFTSLFSLPYYAYNTGTLLSFNGTGIKTVGKNIFDGVLQNGTIDQYGQEQIQANRYRTGFIRALPNTTYCSSIDGRFKVLNFFFYDGNQNFISSSSREIVTTPSNCVYLRFYYDQTILNVNLQVEIGSTPTDYEPYVTNTTSLPISTYFPTGMKSAGSVYDELTESKATKRLELFEITSSNIQSNYLDTQNNQWLGHVSIPDIKQIADGTILANIICNTLETKNQGSLFGEIGSAIALLVNSTNVRITIRGVTTFADMQTWLDNHETYFVYELATPTETPITTEDANEALSLLMGKSVSSSNANQLINIITKGE